MDVLLLYFEFVTIGLFSIGGGLATLPFIYRLAEKYAWLDAARIPDMLAVAQIIPGAIGVNLGAYTGLIAAGPVGALTAAVGLITGPVVIIIVIARLYDGFRKNNVTRRVFEGLRPAAAGLLAAAGYGMLRSSLFQSGVDWYAVLKPRECILFIVFYILLVKLKKLSTLFFIISGAFAGIVLRL
ncbi:MAG: chromate transporter [Spirochaetaceae bacterium]|jgi:chromate transporter|nr:chromate transporter [Spirochaetaceae bacterium]